MLTSIPHGSMLAHKRRKLYRLRMRNLASASRHLEALALQCEKGYTIRERAIDREIHVPANVHRAEAFRAAKKRMLELAKGL
jgi:hypothetical protein